MNKKQRIKTAENKAREAISQLANVSKGNFGELGILRGYIRREMRKVSSIKNGQRVSYGYTVDIYNLLESILGKSKEVMNGDNILRQRICNFVDREEIDGKGLPFVCMNPVDRFHDYCREHSDIIFD